MSNMISERIHKVLGNIIRTFNVSNKKYVGKDDPWMGILAAAAFVNLSTTNRQTCYSPGQLVFGCDMILPIKHRVDWELIRQRKQTQVNKDNAERINGELTITIKLEITSFSLKTVHTNMERHMRAHF